MPYSKPRPGPVDPRTPEIERWIAALPSAWRQVVTMRAICLAYPYVRICPVWREKIAILEDAMHLKPEEHTQVLFEAAAMADGWRAIGSPSRRVAQEEM